MAKTSFDFDLGARVTLSLGKETGVVTGRAHSLDSDPTYHIRYIAADGRQTEAWWSESALKAEVAES